MAMSRCRGARSVTSRPPIEICPADTSSNPAIERRSVDLPGGGTLGLDELATEAGGTASLDYDRRSTGDLVELVNRGDRDVPDAVGAAAPSIAAAVDAIAERLRRGGRLVYVGAGSSGR